MPRSQELSVHRDYLPTILMNDKTGNLLYIQIQIFIVETYIKRFTLHKLNKYKSSTSLSKLKKLLRQNILPNMCIGL